MTTSQEVVITDRMRTPDERVAVRPFRHPWIKGTDVDPECGRTWHDHGWIDRGDHGFTVCPTEAERPDVAEARERAVRAETLSEAAEVWGEGQWQEQWSADHVEDDVSAVRSTVRWLRERAEAVASERSVTHCCPSGDGGVMPCCGKTPLEVSRWARLSVDPEAVTCNSERADDRFRDLHDALADEAAARGE